MPPRPENLAALDALDRERSRDINEQVHQERLGLAQDRFDLSQQNAAFSQAQKLAQADQAISRADAQSDHFRAMEQRAAQLQALQQAKFSADQAKDNSIITDATGFLQALPTLSAVDPDYDKRVMELNVKYPHAAFHPEVAGRMAELRHQRDAKLKFDYDLQKKAAAGLPDAVTNRMADLQAIADTADERIAGLTEINDEKGVIEAKAAKARALSHIKNLKDAYAPESATESSPTSKGSDYLKKYFPTP